MRVENQPKVGNTGAGHPPKNPERLRSNAQNQETTPRTPLVEAHQRGFRIRRRRGERYTHPLRIEPVANPRVS
jgi:hypothetical protein